MNISIEEVRRLKTWFLEYAEGFNDIINNTNITLKLDHTMRVCSGIVKIGKALELSDDELRLAEIMGLLHDVARFEQYKQYQTFMDSRSFNHADMGVEIIKEKDLLKNMEPEASEIILKAILYHNRLKLPDDETTEVLFYSKLLRDADKLDIYKIVTDYYNMPAGKRNNALELELPNTKGYTAGILERVVKGENVDYNTIKNINDFKLLQTGWVFTINFVPTLKLLKKRGYLSILRANLPSDQKIDGFFTEIEKYLQSRC